MRLTRRSMAWIRRLQAEESLTEVRRVAAATGSAGEHGPAMVRQWDAIANPTTVPASARTEERKAAIKAARIKVFRADQTQAT